MNPQHKTCLNCRAVFNRPKNCSAKRWVGRKYCGNQCSREAIADRDAFMLRMAVKEVEPFTPKVVEVKIDVSANLFKFLSGKHRQEVGY